MSTASHALVSALLVAAMFVCAPYALALEPYAQCIQDKTATGMSTDAAAAACSTPTTSTATAQEPYAVCVQAEVAKGYSQSAAATTCINKFAAPTPTYPAAYTACALQAQLLPASQVEAAIAACRVQHLPQTQSDALIGTMIAPAATIGQTPANLASLMEQVKQLQLLIALLTGTSAPGSTSSAVGSCAAFSRSMSRGMSGNDVRQVQLILIAQGFLAAGNDTGYFGPLTEDAVRRWQTAHGIVSSGTADTTGWGVVGPRTRAAMKLCG